MTTTPIEPQPDPEVVPSGDPSIAPPMPGEDPGTIEDPNPPETEPAPV